MFIPPGENIIEKKKCRISGKEFFVTDKDLEFFEKISPIFAGKKYAIPNPTLCPDERLRNRLTWRNDRKFYYKKCDLSGKQFVSMYTTMSPFRVYEPKTWYSDHWSAFEYGRNVNFQEPFFVQYKSLQSRVPRLGIDLVNCENSDYCNYCGDAKDCYMDIAGEGNYRCFYNLFTKYSDFCLDNSFAYRCKNIYSSQFCYDCQFLESSIIMEDCTACSYCFDMKGCSDCILSSNLRNKKYHILNREYTKEEYELMKNTILQNPGKAKKEMNELLKNSIHKDMNLSKTENCIGDNIFESKNCFHCFNVNKSEDCKYLYDVIEAKHCYDMNYSLYHPEWSYNLISTLSLKNSMSSMASHYCRNIYYCDLTNNSENMFGCIGINHGKNCLMNIPYSVQEYETMTGKMIDHMQSTGEWGEFLPHDISPFSYNETVAHEYFPMTEKTVQEKGWNWKQDKETSSYHGPYYIPLQIRQYDERIIGYDIAQKNIDDISAGILQCEVTGSPFKIIKQELAFYIENGLPIPTKHPDQRHKERLEQRNPRTLYEGSCSECGVNIITTYEPERSEKVVCENCYQKLVY